MEYEVNIDSFKAKKPWLDPLFWLSIVVSLFMLGTLLGEAWTNGHFATGEQLFASISPLVTYLFMHGLVRKDGVRAFGEAVAESIHADSRVAAHRLTLTSTASAALDTARPDDAGDGIPDDEQLIEVLRLRDVIPMTPADREALELHDARAETDA